MSYNPLRFSMSVYMHEQWTHAKWSRYTIDYLAIKWIHTTIYNYTYTVSKMDLPFTLYANNISTLFFDSDMKIKARTVYSAIDYDIEMGSYRRTIWLIECNAKCRYLNKLTCKGTLRQVLYLSEAPSPPMTLYSPPLHTCTVYIFSNTCNSLQSRVHKFKNKATKANTHYFMARWVVLESDHSYSIHCNIHISISYDCLFKRWVEVEERMLKCR